MPLPAGERSPRRRPGCPAVLANTTHGEGVRRGVGYGVGFKNISFPAGFPDFSTATVTLSIAGGEPIAEVHTAAAEVGQGLVTIQAQIARTELGVDRAFVRTADTTIGMAGGTSASRQTWMTGGAVKAACEAVREVVLELRRAHLGYAARRRSPRRLLRRRRRRRRDPVAMVELITDESDRGDPRVLPGASDHPLDENGQGSIFMAYAFAAHRAVVDVDTELGLVKVVEIATVQDVGKAMNPQARRGPDRGRHRPGSRPGPDGGARDRGRPGAQRLRSPTT